MIEFIFVITDLSSSASPSGPLLFKLVSELNFLWDFTTEKVASFLLGVEVAPLWVFILVFVISCKISGRSRPILLLFMLIIV